MARLTIALCLGLLCLAVTTSAFQFKKRGGGGGGRSQGGGSQGGGSQGGGSQGGGNSQGGNSGESKPAESITTEEFKGFLKEFAEVFEDASAGFAKVESLSKNAYSSEKIEDWITAIVEFIKLVTGDLAKLEPAVDQLGHVMESIAASPKEFRPLPYCDNSAKLANGKTEVADFGVAKADVWIEDLGCFKDKLAEVTFISEEALKESEYTELEAMELYGNIIEKAVLLGKAFERFSDANEKLNESGGSSKRSQMNTLIRLLKELKLDSRK